MKQVCLRWSSIALTLFLVVAGVSTTASRARGDTGRSSSDDASMNEARGAPDSPGEPTGDLRLRDALTLALLHNPRLKAFSWNLRAAEAAQLQAKAWPNPQLGFEYEDFAGSGDLRGTKGAEATLVMSQLVPLGGKLGKRTEVARLETQVSNWDWEIARIETHVAAVTAFANVLAAQERLALVDEIVALTRDIEEAVSARVRAGGTLALEENRARVAVGTTLIERRLAKGNVTIARRELASIWGSNLPRFARAVGVIDEIAEEIPRLDDLLARVEGNPEVSRWTTELERRRAQVRLLRTDRIPDVDIGVGIRHQSAVDDLAFVVGLRATLPTWDRKGGAIREMELGAEQSGHERRAVERDVRRDIAVAHEVLAGAFEEITRLRADVLPGARAAATKSVDAYRAGAIRLTDVLDIQRTFFRLRVRWVNALAQYHGAMAELEGLVGEPMGQSPFWGLPGDGMENER